ncbi:DNA-binding response regulator [Vallitalea pronyensis]|uniref:DNA-binding response regulator n=1 Tax=Vallitalea pronyensis TaxID=1348613 RepID=A0A8J8MQ89_9FIRM|nr:helix-turn-helix domain-containing protein [Vallitalea pronyensis]QUI25443.1 DNA-binding response regulator [Vallitalea pronyensis]
MIHVLIVSEKTLTRVGISYSIFWEKFGYTIIDQAASLSEALVKIEASKPKLVFVELPFKTEDNTSVIEHLKSYPCQLVILSADIHAFNHAFLHNLGVLDVMSTENFQTDDLIDRLNHYSQTLFTLPEENANLKLDIQKDILNAAKQQFLRKLLCGWNKKNVLSPATLQHYGIQFPYNQFIILMVKLEGMSQTEDIQTLAHFFKHKFINKNVYLCENGLDELVCIYNVDFSRHMNPHDIIHHFKSHVTHLMEVNFQVPFSVYASNAYIGVANIATAYKECFQNYQQAMKPMKNNDSTENIYIKTIKAYIEKHYADDIKADDLAVEVNLTPSYFSTFFKSETGQTYKNYLIDYRLTKARELLTTTTLHVVEIAQLVGYPNENYFSKLFKQKMGMSPTQYRKSPPTNG